MSKTQLLDFSRFHKQMVAALVDAFFLPLTFCIAISLRFDGFSSAIFLPYLWLILAVPVVSIPLFMKLGLYRAVMRYIDQQDRLCGVDRRYVVGRNLDGHGGIGVAHGGFVARGIRHLLGVLDHVC